RGCPASVVQADGAPAIPCTERWFPRRQLKKLKLRPLREPPPRDLRISSCQAIPVSAAEAAAPPKRRVGLKRWWPGMDEGVTVGGAAKEGAHPDLRIPPL